MRSTFLKKIPQWDPKPVVLSTRIRLARNLADQPFPGWAREAQKRSVLSQCEMALSKLPEFAKGDLFRMGDLDKTDRLVLVEKHLISKELVDTTKYAAVCVSACQDYAVMINEEDHLRIQALGNDLKFLPTWKKLTALDDAIEARLSFAFSSEWGYLTACPTNLGTGMRASAMMHLPGLVLADLIDPVIRSLNAMNIMVRGLFGEGSDAKGSFFQISNQQTLGESEETILERLQHLLGKLLEHELYAREKVIHEQPHKVLDKISRAYGVLTNGCYTSADESMNLLSLIRLGIDYGMFPEVQRKKIDRLFTEVQPAHIELKMSSAKSSDQRDAFRATFLRKEFANFPKPSV